MGLQSIFKLSGVLRPRVRRPSVHTEKYSRGRVNDLVKDYVRGFGFTTEYGSCGPVHSAWASGVKELLG